MGGEERVEKFGWTLKVVLDCKAPLKQLQQLATKVAGCDKKMLKAKKFDDSLKIVIDYKASLIAAKQTKSTQSCFEVR